MLQVTKDQVINELLPRLPELCFFLGNSCHANQFYPQAEKWYEYAICLNDKFGEAYEALMNTLISQKKFEEGIRIATLVMENGDENQATVAQYNRGLMYLSLGDYINGFKDYDTRMRMGKTIDLLRKKIGDRSLWDGKPCNHLLVYGEQGMGDLFMFSRFMKDYNNGRNLLSYCDKVTLEVPPGMTSFMKYNFERERLKIIPQTEEVTISDKHILLVSLARIFETDINSIPFATESYLIAEPEYTKKWDKISRLPDKKIGICWAGRSVIEQDLQVAEWNSRRSISLKQLGPVLNLPNISWVSLQKGVDEIQLKDFPSIYNFGDEIKSWSDTAGIMHHLDLIISIDSGPVHLAGAMGKPTILLNHASTCWRWGLTGEQSIWYDSINILRQEKDFNWNPVINELYDILSKEVGV